MTKPIRLEKWISVQDSNGEWDESITEKINVFAEVSRSGGDRSSLNGKEGLTNFFIFRFRYNPKIDPTSNWRVIYDGRRFTPHSIEKENQNTFYWIIKAEAK